MSPETLRLFLAVPLSHVFLSEIKDILSPLQQKIPGVKWADPGQVHVTLHFFGDVPAPEIGRIDQAMRNILPRFGPMNVRLNGVGVFPDLKRPHVIWIGVEEGTGAFLELQKTVQNEILSLGFVIEERPFKPHATIGRVKRSHGPAPDFGNRFRIDFAFPTEVKVLDHFILYQSRLLPEGARYEALKTFQLTQTR